MLAGRGGTVGGSVDASRGGRAARREGGHYERASGVNVGTRGLLRARDLGCAPEEEKEEEGLQKSGKRSLTERQTRRSLLGACSPLCHNQIAGMMESSGKDEDKEKEQLKKTVGGGQFVKVDRI